MKLTIFGGTGRTGQILIRQALEKGYPVTALARSPEKLALQHPNLRVVQGNLQDPTCVTGVIAGADAVISVLGPTSNQPIYAVSQGTANILSAMQAAGVPRLVVSAGAGVSAPGDTPKLFNRLMNRLLQATARYVYEDMLRAVEEVRASDRDWTVVRVPMLIDGSGTGQVKVGMVGKGMGARITRADLARFLLARAEQGDFIRQSPAISN